MARKQAAKKDVPTVPLPKIFIGSSSEGSRVAQALGVSLDRDRVAQPCHWSNVFDLSSTTVESLEQAAIECPFAVFVLTPDDFVKSRGATKKSPRDNVLWEHGLFCGKNGRDHTFILMPSDVENLKIPSDLLGVTVATYESARLENDITAALSTASFEIGQAIKKAVKIDSPAAASPTLVSPTTSPAEAPPTPSGEIEQAKLRTLATNHVAELLSMLGAGTAGLSMVPSDPAKVRRWAENLLYMARKLFERKWDGAYATWLRPDASRPPELVSYLTEGVADLAGHHTFAAGEGLAGNAWSEGKAAGHSPDHPHEWWTLRKGCENNVYLCAPVGPFSGTGGLLAVGADKGLGVTEDDVAILRMFASLLGFVVQLLPVASDSARTVPMKAIGSASPRDRSGA